MIQSYREPNMFESVTIFQEPMELGTTRASVEGPPGDTPRMAKALIRSVGPKSEPQRHSKSPGSAQLDKALLVLLRNPSTPAGRF